MTGYWSGDDGLDDALSAPETLVERVGVDDVYSGILDGVDLAPLVLFEPGTGDSAVNVLLWPLLPGEIEVLNKMS